MKYKITIERMEPPKSDEKYGTTVTVYEQTVATEDDNDFVRGVIAVVNNLTGL